MMCGTPHGMIKMKVLKKAKVWEKIITCPNTFCEAELQIEESDLIFRWVGANYGGDSPEKTIGVICAECGDFIALEDLQYGAPHLWNIAEKNMKPGKSVDGTLGYD